MTEEPNKREDHMPTPFTDALARRRAEEDHRYWRFVALVAVVMSVLVFLVYATGASATTAAQRIEQGIQRSHYSGRCGRGAFRACHYVGRPHVVRHDPKTGWWRFVGGYYEEWRPSLLGRRLYACRLNGWAYPGRPIAVDYNHCYRR